MIKNKMKWFKKEKITKEEYDFIEYKEYIDKIQNDGIEEKELPYFFHQIFKSPEYRYYVSGMTIKIYKNEKHKDYCYYIF